MTDEERVGLPCQALKSSGPCECTGFVKSAEPSGMYTVCAVEGCGNSAQIHYEKTDEIARVKR